MLTLKLTLSRTLSVLRRTIGAGRFLAGWESVVLDPQAAMWVDVLHFRQQLNACRQTALLSEFTRRAQRTHPDLIVAGGNCSAYAGFGDPYLPFREVMEMLTGDLSRRDYAEEGAAWFERLLAVADEEISPVVRAQALA